jgi:hypothetical protein
MILGILAFSLLIGAGISFAGAPARGVLLPTPEGPVAVETSEPTRLPSPTLTLRPTATPTSTPSPTPTRSSSTVTVSPTRSAVDPAYDLARYEDLSALDVTVPGADIERASLDHDGALLTTSTASIPVTPTEDSLLLWVELHAPLPEPPATVGYWLFALDTDGDVTTGRPPGDGRINPDLGAELTVGVFVDPAESVAFRPYLLVWDADREEMSRSVPQAEVRLNAPRDTLLLVLSRTELEAQLTMLSDVTPAWANARGRAATLVSHQGEMLIDFYPDLP